MRVRVDGNEKRWLLQRKDLDPPSQNKKTRPWGKFINPLTTQQNTLSSSVTTKPIIIDQT